MKKKLTSVNVDVIGHTVVVVMTVAVTTGGAPPPVAIAAVAKANMVKILFNIVTWMGWQVIIAKVCEWVNESWNEHKRRTKVLSNDSEVRISLGERGWMRFKRGWHACRNKEV
jgi:hypothetical protein